MGRECFFGYKATILAGSQLLIIPFLIMTTIKKKSNTTSIPEAVIYMDLRLPAPIPETEFDIEALREEIALQVQGEAVEISEEHPISLLMIAFDVAHKVSPEMILRLNSGKRVLLFNHWGAPILRDKDIYMIKKIAEGQKTKSNKSKFIADLIINLEDIWKKIKADNKKDELKAVEKGLKEVVKFIKPAMVTTLVGKAPVLFFYLPNIYCTAKQEGFGIRKI